MPFPFRRKYDKLFWFYYSICTASGTQTLTRKRRELLYAKHEVGRNNDMGGVWQHKVSVKSAYMRAAYKRPLYTEMSELELPILKFYECSMELLPTQIAHIGSSPRVLYNGFRITKLSYWNGQFGRFTFV